MQDVLCKVASNLSLASMVSGFISGDTVDALVAGVGPGRHAEMLVRCTESFAITGTPFVNFMLSVSSVIDPLLAPATSVIVANGPPIGFLLHRNVALMSAGDEVIIPIGYPVEDLPSAVDRRYWTFVAFNPYSALGSFTAGKIDAFIGTGFSSGPRRYPAALRNL